jgi:hypothetical protein
MYLLNSSYIFLFSGQVFKGIWSKTTVAIKVLRTDAGVQANNDVCYPFVGR